MKTPDDLLQRGTAKPLNYLRIESFNVVLKRDFFEAMVAEGVAALNIDKLSEYSGVTSVATGDGIIAVQFANADCLRAFHGCEP